jgi:flagellar biosynthesis component FlhA
MVESVSELSAHFEETLFQAEQDGLDRHEVADLLERLADEVRKGYTELPEHRGP